jgi:gamma-glutamyltranspeptidase/glutathione hydrolase
VCGFITFYQVNLHAQSTGRFGMITSAHEIASRIGLDVLKSGGNAIDASIAVAYALAVVYPSAGNLGGGGFATIRLKDGKSVFIDFRETAPLNANASMYLNTNGDPITLSSRRGMLAVAVPGTVAGLEYLREKFGTLSRDALINPAINLAHDGFVLTTSDANALRQVFQSGGYNAAFKEVFFPHSQPLREGNLLIQKDLAHALTLIRDHGQKGFYEGELAVQLVRAIQSENGIISMKDLSEYHVREFSPIECDYRGYHVISAPPPSSGGLVICEILNILEGYPLNENGSQSPQSVHWTTEAFKRAYYDRNNELGDPEFVKNPLQKFLSKTRANEIRNEVSTSKATSSLKWGIEIGHQEGINTTHLSIVDKDENAVALTYTLNESFGSRSVAQGTGIILNNEMDDFTIKVGQPNSFDLFQGEPNLIAPQKRPLSSMSPTIVTHEDKLFLVIGTPGGSKIISTVAQVLLNLIDYGMNLQQAIDQPRFHHQWLPDVISMEPNAIPQETIHQLETMGHVLKQISPVNHVDAILVQDIKKDSKSQNTPHLIGVNDKRGNTGLAIGY